MAKGIPAVAFHAGLDAETKRAAHARFRSGEAVVVADRVFDPATVYPKKS